MISIAVFLAVRKNLVPCFLWVRPKRTSEVWRLEICGQLGRGADKRVAAPIWRRRFRRDIRLVSSIVLTRRMHGARFS